MQLLQKVFFAENWMQVQRNMSVQQSGVDPACDSHGQFSVYVIIDIVT